MNGMKYNLKVLQILLGFSLLWAKPPASIHQCPKPEDIFPCTCVHNKAWDSVDLECANINQSQLQVVNSHLHNYVFDTYYIHDTKLENIRKSGFDKLKVKILRLVDCEIKVFELFNGIRGMNNTLKKLTIDNVDIQYWVYTSGDDFVKLRVFEYNDCPKSQGNEIRIIPFLPKNVTEINFHECTITSDKGFTFMEFVNLKHLVLSSNQLTSVKRDYLPRPALHLTFYSLSNNPIKSLPDDMFVEMPALSTVWLQGTLITTLHYQVFKPILKRLEVMQIWDIPLNCNCEAEWLLRDRRVWQLGGANCQSPRRLKGKELDSLHYEDLCPLNITLNDVKQPFYKG